VVASRFEALRGSKLSPLVGRDEEIELLLRRWARTKAGEGQVVLISGEPVSASRASRRHWQSASTPSRTSVCAIFARRLGRAAEFGRDDTPAVKLEKHEVLLALAAPPDEDVALLADLLSLPASARHPLPNLSPQRKKERTLEALIRQLEGLAR
jgi:hypothetical protein